MFRRSRLSACVLLGILIATAICLLTTNFFSRHEVHTSKAVGDNANMKANGAKVTDDGNRIEIEPFPEFESKESDIVPGLYLAEKSSWWSWNGDSDCIRHRVHLLKPGSQPKPGAFISFPGSGNTWLRTVLMSVTGFFIGSVYENTFQSDANSSQKLANDCNCWLLQKTHDFALYTNPGGSSLANGSTLEKFEGKGILLIRDPFKAIQSYLNFIHGGMTGTAPKSAFEGTEWEEFVRHSVYSWERLATVWIRGLQQGGVVYYENLYHNTPSELKRLLKMIGFNNYDKDRFECGLRHAYDKTFKRKTSASQSPYTDKQKLLIQKAVGNVQLALKERGLDPLPVHHYMI